MAKPTHHIVFDWNGTLLNDFETVHGLTNHMITGEGHEPVTLELFQEHYEIPFTKLYNNLGLEPHQVQRLIDVQAINFNDLYEAASANVPLRDGAIDALAHAKTHNIASFILSNHIVEPIKLHLKRLGIEHFFDEVLAFASRATQFKDMSKGERLRRFRAEQGLSDHPTIIVGDSVEEIEIAHEQKFISVAITGGCVSEKRLRAAKPDYVIHSLGELPAILRERRFAA